MSDDPFKKLNDSIAERQEFETGSRTIGYVEGALESAKSGFGEFFGAAPSLEAEVFRAQNPVGGFLTSMASPAGVYGAAFKVSKLPSIAKKLDRVYDAAGGLEKPKRARAAKELLRFAPVEASRLGMGAFMDGDYGNLFADVALNVGLTGIFGAGAGFFDAAGRAQKRAPQLAPGIRLDLRPTFQLRQAEELMALRPDPVYSKSAELLRREILTEVPAKGERYVGKLAFGGSGIKGKAGDGFDGLFSIGNRKSMNKTFLAVGPHGFEDDAAQAAFFSRAKIGPEDLKYMVTPRLVSAKTPEGAKRLAGILTNQGFMAEPGKWYALEENGLYVVVEKIAGRIGQRGITKDAANPKSRPARTDAAANRRAADVGDEYLIYKTDDPLRRAPILERHRRTISENWAMLRKFAHHDAPVSGNIVNDAMQTWKSVVDWRAGGKIPDEQSLTAMARKVIGKNLDEESSAVRGFKNWFKTYLTPTQFQFFGNTIADRLLSVARVANDTAENYVNRVINGVQRVPEGSVTKKVLLSSGARRDFAEGFPSAREIFSKLDDETFEEVFYAPIRGVTLDNMADLVQRGDLSAKAANALRQLDALDQDSIRQLTSGLHMTDNPEMFKPRGGYFLMPRQLLGEFKAFLVNQQGENVLAFSGRNQAHAQKIGERLIKILEEQGETGLTMKPFGEMDFDDVRLLVGDKASEGRRRLFGDALFRAMAPPKTFKERKGVRFDTDYFLPSKDEVLQMMESTLKRKHRIVAHEQWRKQFSDIRVSLVNSDRVAAEILDKRLQQMLGHEGKFNTEVNKFVDRALAPMLGKNSASKIAHAANQSMFMLQFGFFNPMFITLSVLSPIQTVLPHLYFLKRASPGALSQLVSYQPVSKGGQIVGAAAHVSPLKLMQEGLRQLKKPDKEFGFMLERAANDGIIVPRMVEAFVGQQATALKGIKETALEGRWWDTIRAVGSFFANKSEEWSRMYAFSVNYLAGRHLMQITDPEQLYLFASEQVQRTMFNYASMDRALAMSGPIGTPIGLFKNWQMHYMGLMMQYADVGLKENVWSPLLWQVGSTAAIGGIGATPIAPLADGLARWAGNVDAYDAARERWGETFSDGVWYGLPAFLGVSLQASASMPGADAMRDASMFFSLVHFDRAAALGKALGTGWETWIETGANPVADPNVRDMVTRALAPRAFYRAIQSAEGNYIRSLSTGYPLLRDVSPHQQFLYGLGMNPIEIERAFTEADYLWKDVEAMRASVQAYGAQIAQAQLAKDYREVTRLYTTAAARALPLDRIAESAETRLSRELYEDMFDKFSIEQQIESLGGPVDD